MNNKVRIENPCNENWNSMSPNKKGRFCNTCNKTVVDFTKMKYPEIQKYFIENSATDSICGYYKFNQVANENNSKYTTLRNRFDRIKIKPIKIVALFSLSFLFSFTSCMMGKQVPEKPEEQIENDTINNNKAIDTVQDSVKKNDSLTTKQELKKKK